ISRTASARLAQENVVVLDLGSMALAIASTKARCVRQDRAVMVAVPGWDRAWSIQSLTRWGMVCPAGTATRTVRGARSRARLGLRVRRRSLFQGWSVCGVSPRMGSECVAAVAMVGSER